MDISAQVSVLFLVMLVAGGALWFLYVRRRPLKGNGDVAVNYRRCRRLKKAGYAFFGVSTLFCFIFIYNVDMVPEKKYWEISRLEYPEARSVVRYDYNFLYSEYLAGIPYEAVIGESGVDCLLAEYRERAESLTWYQESFIELITAHSTGWRNFYMISSASALVLIIVTLLYDGAIKDFENENSEVMAE